MPRPVAPGAGIQLSREPGDLHAEQDVTGLNARAAVHHGLRESSHPELCVPLPQHVWWQESPLVVEVDGLPVRALRAGVAAGARIAGRHLAAEAVPTAGVE